MTVHAIQRAVRRERARGFVMVALATGLAIMVAVLVASGLAGSTSSDARRALAVKIGLGACARGNVVRAYAWQTAFEATDHPVQRLARAKLVFPILDCPATVASGVPVALPRVQQRRFVKRTIPVLPSP